MFVFLDYINIQRMYLRFSSHHSAILFAASKRDEGYFAQVLDENVGHLWGAATVGGFRVLMSDDPVTQKEMPPKSLFYFPNSINWIIGILIFLGMIELSVLLLNIVLGMTFEIAKFAFFFPTGFFLVIVLFWLPLIGAFWIAIKLMRVWKNPDSQWHFLARLFIAGLGFLLVVMKVLTV